ncbi:MAG: hypothetical protein GC188_07335 [Alphaproteobacteria bacterium]|nr:hypothetical protein [Alphaproteobacteria bacterium]
MNVMTLIAAILLEQAAPPIPDTQYEPSVAHPFGQPNPAAPAELAQFAFFAGAFDCTDRRLGPDGEWVEFPAIWNGHYFLNGHAIQDQYWAPGFYTTNIRQFDEAEGVWKVGFFSEPGYSNGIWTGGLEGEDIVLTRPLTRPDGTEIISRLTFSDISDSGFSWSGAVVTDAGARENWTSLCVRRQ